MREKLISEKWLREYLDGYDAKVLEPAVLQMLNNFYAALIEAPAVDAVEVVRCKDCRMFQPKTTEFLQHCERTDLFVRNNDFCSFGDRGEDNAVD